MAVALVGTIGAVSGPTLNTAITPAYWGLLLSDPVSASTPEAFYRLPVIT
jgi:hypothetical protein